jgi:hypothetical protein
MALFETVQAAMPPNECGRAMDSPFRRRPTNTESSTLHHAFACSLSRFLGVKK